MAVNTETKRRSVAGMLIAALVIAPVPDGTIAAVDREHIIGIYAGIPPVSPAVATDHIHIFSTGKVEPNHIADSGDNFLLAGAIEVQGAGWVEGVLAVKGIADGGRTNYDLKVGDTDGSPTYGMIQMGNASIGRTSHTDGIDLDGAVLIRNIAGPVTSEIEFIFAESSGSSCRFALPKSAVGNATYNPRSMLIAGPAPADTDFVKVTYWRTNNSIFHNIDCDTAGAGADLGVQNDLEVEGDIFVDTIKESTSGAGIRLGGATDYTKVEADGTLEFNGDATVFKDINIGAATLSGPPGLQPGIVNFVDNLGADTGIATFGLAVGEGFSGQFEMQHDYKEGSDITFHVHYQGIAAPTGTDKIQFQLTYTFGNFGVTLAPVTIITVEADIDTQYEFNALSFTAITGTDIDIMDQFLFTFERIAASADEYGGEAVVATVGVHYELDTIGSRQILVK